MTLCEFFKKFNEWLKRENKHFAPQESFDNELLEAYEDYKYTMHEKKENNFDLLSFNTWLNNSEYAQNSIKNGYKDLFEEYKISIEEFCN
jgi:hypothetical protein